MKLSEGKLFAIKALNRIGGFEWPEWAQFAEVDVGNKVAVFKRLIDGKTAHMRGINISQDCGEAGYLVSVTKEEFDSVSTAPTHNIESLISQHKAARLSTLEVRRQLEHAEAAEHSLLLSIEAWAESQGFDIRLLDKAEEKPELVVTDWRDLRVGDVVRCWGKNYEMFVVDVYLDSSGGEAVFLAKTKNGSRYTVHDGDWKFICRPFK